MAKFAAFLAGLIVLGAVLGAAVYGNATSVSREQYDAIVQHSTNADAVLAATQARLETEQREKERLLNEKNEAERRADIALVRGGGDTAMIVGLVIAGMLAIAGMMLFFVGLTNRSARRDAMPSAYEVFLPLMERLASLEAAMRESPGWSVRLPSGERQRLPPPRR